VHDNGFRSRGFIAGAGEKLQGRIAEQQQGDDHVPKFHSDAPCTLFFHFKT
jgi:hypothetical protein